ncbi:MAG: cache domain-containing protein, partial [Anaerolineales bacterium]
MLRWLRNYPIVLRTMVMTVMAVVIVLAFFAFLGSNAVEDSTREIQQMQLRYAGLAADSLDSQLENCFRALARQADVLAADPNTSISVNDILPPLLHTGLFPNGVFFLDPAGTIIAAEPSMTDAAMQKLREAPVVRKALTTGLRQTGDFPSGAGGDPQVILLEPVKDSKGTVIGWLGGMADLAAFPFVLGEQTGSQALIIDSAGNGLALDGDNHLAILPVLYYAELLPYLQKQEPGIARLDKSVIHTEDSIIAVLSPLENAPWTVVIESPETEVYGLLTTLRWQFVYFGAIILVVAVVSAWIFNEVVLGPIRVLLRATRQL